MAISPGKLSRLTDRAEQRLRKAARFGERIRNLFGPAGESRYRPDRSALVLAPPLSRKLGGGLQLGVSGSPSSVRSLLRRKVQQHRREIVVRDVQAHSS